MYMSYKKAQLREAEDKIIEQQTRLTKIRNQNKADMLSEAFWRQRQLELYPNAFQINTGIPTPQEVFITQQIDNVDEETKRNLVMNNLSKISDQEIANYIIDKLTPDETTYVLNSFDKIKREIAKYYPKGLSKEDFVHFIQQQYFS